MSQTPKTPKTPKSPIKTTDKFSDKFMDKFKDDDLKGDSIDENELIFNKGNIQIVKDEHRNLFIRIRNDIDVIIKNQLNQLY